MKKKITLSIPKPCHEDWHQMTPSERGRFCGACQKTVVDFTSMSDREIIGFFQNGQTGICGRLQAYQLDRPLSKPKTPWPYVRYFFQVLLPAFLLSQKGASQERTVGKIAVCKPVAQGDTLLQKSEPAPTPIPVMTGSVTDEHGTGIPFATITIENSIKSIVCDSSGAFRVSDSEFFQKPIRISSIGYESKTSFLKSGTNHTIRLNMAVSGEVVTAGFIVISSRKQKRVKPISLIAPTPKPETYFTVFPNPAQSKAAITINWKGMAQGEYRIVIQPVGGQIIWSGQTPVTLTSSKYTFQLPVLLAGNYLITTVHKKTGRVYSEKMIVQ